MPLAVEQIRRMRGGAQAQLMRCEDGNYYIVKFQNNPQGSRILANELLAIRLAARLGLPVQAAAVVEVHKELIEQTEDLVIELGRMRTACRAGLQFGSRYPGDPATAAVYDFLPDGPLGEVENVTDFLGMLVFDKWTCNTNGRQAIFLRAPGEKRYSARMIDQGFCFNANEWNFPDAPLRGLYPRRVVYQSVMGLDSFAVGLERLEKNITEEFLDKAAGEIPPEWYDFDQDSLYRLLEQLLRRKELVPALLEQARKTYRDPFPNWK